MDSVDLRTEGTKKRSYYILSLSKYIKGFVPYLLGAIASKLFFKLIPLMINLLVSYIVSDMIFQGTKNFLGLCMLTAVCILFSVLFAFLDIYLSHDMSYKILTDLRGKVYDKIDETAPSGIADKQSGEVISTIINDIEFFEWFYAHILVEWIVLALISFTVLIFMGTFSWMLPAVIVPFMLLILLIPQLLAKKADIQGRAVRDKAGILNAKIIDGIQGLKEIISFRWQQHYFDRFFKAIDEYNEAEISYTKRSADEKRWITALMEIAGVATMIVIVALVIDGKIDKVWLMPMFTLSYAIFSPLQDAMGLSTNYGFVYGAAKRVFDLLQLKGMVQDRGTKTVSDLSLSDGYRITFEEVFFAYPTEGSDPVEVLKGISFEIVSGETVALVAGSGGGKTTIARALQRFWDIQSGAIRINGVDIRELSIEQLRDLVTVVTQDIYIFNDSILGNLRLARPGADLKEIEEACKIAQADPFIKSLPDGYDTIVGERGAKLSGGEKQRIAIAQALLKNSPILVLDESSANLDMENERLINMAIDRLKEGRTTIVIAHRVSTIKNADRIIFIDGGVVSGEGSYQELVNTNNRFKKLVGEEK
ncbi:MAG: ABC transporter ATP-binding protein [Peptostreptococcaceae bacterium]|nr:ABC transporter ATP-binding protein [Peptostreptococcaceae bacterium]